MTLVAVYDLLQAVSVSYTDSDSVSQTPTVFKPSTMPQNLVGADFPIRVLGWLGEDNHGEIGHISLKGTGSVDEWRIDDTMYLKPLGSGETLNDVVYDLTLYIDAHAAAMKAAKKLATGTHVVSWRYTRGVMNWGKTPYWIVNANLTISEIT